MNQQILISFFLIFILSCAGQSATNYEMKQNEIITNLEKSDIDSTMNLRILTREEKNITILNQPCEELQEFVVEIEKNNWVSDNERLEKVNIYSELDRMSLKYFNNKPFYQIDFENSRLNSAFGKNLESNYFDSTDFKMFKDVKNIWGYFYRGKKDTKMISDGVIEQWEFENETQAEQALVKMQKIGYDVYFNISPYFCRIRNKLIVFQSRAMAFSYDQKLVFEQFIKN